MIELGNGLKPPAEVQSRDRDVATSPTTGDSRGPRIRPRGSSRFEGGGIVAPTLSGRNLEPPCGAVHRAAPSNSGGERSNQSSSHWLLIRYFPPRRTAFNSPRRR